MIKTFFTSIALMLFSTTYRNGLDGLWCSGIAGIKFSADFENEAYATTTGTELQEIHTAYDCNHNFRIALRLTTLKSSTKFCCVVNHKHGKI